MREKSRAKARPRQVRRPKPHTVKTIPSPVDLWPEAKKLAREGRKEPLQVLDKYNQAVAAMLRNEKSTEQLFHQWDAAVAAIENARNWKPYLACGEIHKKVNASLLEGKKLFKAAMDAWLKYEQVMGRMN